MIPDSIREHVKGCHLMFLDTRVEDFSKEDLIVLVLWLQKENDKLRDKTYKLMLEKFE